LIIDPDRTADIIDEVLMLLRNAIIALVLAGFTTPAIAADPAEGKKIAQRWCSECHLVSPNQSGSVPVGPPPFKSIAQSNKGSIDYLTTFLQAPHTKDMQGLKLNRYDINDLAAYIESLSGD
jgi:mono/diheme cytochrome c family protein